MPRAIRTCPGGFVYHVLNRSNGRLRMFRKDDDFAAFERILAEGIERFNIRLTGYCLMSNHWHLLLWPPAFIGAQRRYTPSGVGNKEVRNVSEGILTYKNDYDQAKGLGYRKN